jgi:hypothetical protein
MDTARIDIQSLQFLNARILQTIDALNQIRLSLHSMTQTDPTSFGMAGLAHTTPNAFTNSWAANPYVAQAQVWGAPVNSPFNPLVSGLGHSTPINFVDPRIARTFPFAQGGYSPVAQTYAPFGGGIY